MQPRRFTLVIAMAALVYVICQANFLAWGQGGKGNWVEESMKGTLRGLPGVYVSVPVTGQGVRLRDLDQKKLKTDVELLLHRAGIRVLTEEEAGRTMTTPVLLVEVSTVPGPKSLQDVFAASVEVSLLQVAFLPGEPPLQFLARTWSGGKTLGMIGRTQLKSKVRERMVEFVDAFISDYLAVNPK